VNIQGTQKKQTPKSRGWTKLGHGWWSLRLPRHLKDTLGTLLSFSFGKQTFTVSTAAIAERRGLKKRQTLSSIKQLEQQGYIRVARQHGKKNSYTLLTIDAESGAVVSAPVSESQIAPVVAQPLLHQSGAVAIAPVKTSKTKKDDDRDRVVVSLLKQYDLYDDDLARLATNSPHEELGPYLKWLSENDGIANKPGYLRKVLGSDGRLTVPVNTRQQAGQQAQREYQEQKESVIRDMIERVEQGLPLEDVPMEVVCHYSVPLDIGEAIAREVEDRMPKEAAP